MPEGVEYAVKIGAVAVRRREGEASCMSEAGLSERLRNRAVVGIQPHHRAEGHAVPPAATAADRHQGPRSRCSKPGSAWRRSRAGRTRRPRRCGSTTSAGRRRPARRTGRCGRCSYGESWPPKLFNTAYYKNDQVDGDIKGALLTTDSAEKAELYKDAQETIWNDAPWAPLVTEKLLSAHNKKLTGVYVMPGRRRSTLPKSI